MSQEQLSLSWLISVWPRGQGQRGTSPPSKASFPSSLSLCPSPSPSLWASFQRHAYAPPWCTKQNPKQNTQWRAKESPGGLLSSECYGLYQSSILEMLTWIESGWGGMKCVTVCYNADLSEVIVCKWCTQRGFVLPLDKILRHCAALGCFVQDAEWERLLEGWKPWWYVAIMDMQVWCHAQGVCMCVHLHKSSTTCLLVCISAHQCICILLLRVPCKCFCLCV